MGSDTTLSYLVHALGAYLYLHPFLFRSQDGDVQTLVTVGLGYGEPVTQTLGVGLVHVSDDGIGLPALHHLTRVGFRIDRLLSVITFQDDTDGKEVIDALKGTLLLLHLLPDGVDGLGAPFDVEVQTSSLQFLLDGSDEAGDIGITALLGSVELLTDVVVGVVLQVFHAEVLELTLQLIESQLMG